MKPAFEGEQRIIDEEILRTLRGIGDVRDYTERKERIVEMLDELRDLKDRIRFAITVNEAMPMKGQSDEALIAAMVRSQASSLGQHAHENGAMQNKVELDEERNVKVVTSRICYIMPPKKT